MTFRKRINPRGQYREQQRARITASPSLAIRFPQLKSLTADLIYHGSGEGNSNRVMRCTFNLDQARSLFCFDCDNLECVGGDFDLTEPLAAAVATHQSEVTGELRCEGWRTKAQIERHPCHHRLHYRFKLKYGTPPGNALTRS